MSFSRRQALLSAAGVAASLFLSRGLLAEDEPIRPAAKSAPDPLAAMNAVPIVERELAANVRVLSGPGGNVTVVLAGAGKVVVDSGLGARGKDFLAAAVKTDGKPVNTLVNTHFHFDHVGGNEAFGEAGARIVAHTKTRARLSAKQVNDFMGLNFEPYPKAALPTTTLDDGLVLYAGDEELRLIHVGPAHTDTDVALHLPGADVIVTGDLYFNGLYPFIDYSAGGSIEGTIAAGERLLKLAGEKTKIVPGHGPLASRGDYRGFVDMLAEVKKRFDAAIGKGMSEKDAIAADLFKDLNPKWGQQMFTGAKFTSLLYWGKRQQQK